MQVETRLGTTTGSAEPVRCLPPSDYDSLALQAKEDAAIWTRAWVGLGFAADVANAGDLLPVTVGNHGVHVERQVDGSIVGRFNKAQHGGCRAVPLQCRTGAKTKCSFTACGYSRDRRPIAAADPDRLLHLDQYLGLRPERLLTVPTQAWGPVIAARLDPLASSPFDWPNVEPVEEALFGGGETLWIEHDANWKHMMVALSVGDRRYRAAARFPNVVALIGEDARCFIVVHPTALQRTLCRIRIFMSDDAADAERATADVLEAVSLRAKRAATWQADPMGALADRHADAARRWFEGRVLDAFDGLDDEERSGAFYRTNQRGGW